MYFLDTNIVIAALSRRQPGVAARLDVELGRGSTVQLSSVVLFELRLGIEKSARAAENARLLSEFIGFRMAVIPFDADDAAEAADIRAVLEARGTPIGPYDTLIAGHARRRQVVLVTNNRREFDRVPGLTVSDWGAR